MRGRVHYSRYNTDRGEIGQLMMRVRRDVFEATEQRQVPWEHFFAHRSVLFPSRYRQRAATASYANSSGTSTGSGTAVHPETAPDRCPQAGLM
jgi:uncharacterized caspase-like protein